MRIVYLHQYFFTRTMIGVAGNRSYEFARRLVAMGHEVDMVTSYTHATRDEPLEWFETNEDGIRVHWLPVPYSNKMAFRERIGAFLRFAIGASRKAASLDGDVVFATSGPLTIAIPGLYASWSRGVPLVFEVRDLWPEGAIQLGVLTNPLAKWLARRLERLTYRNARHIVALSPGMRDGILAAGIDGGKVTVIPNAADLDLFHPRIDGASMRLQNGLDGRFCIAYFGTMGLANGLGFVLDAAAELKRRNVSDIVFMLHGDGMERPILEARARGEGLDNIIFSGPTPKHLMAELVSAVDVCMTIFKNVPVLRTCSPNKLFDSLAAGKPILTNMPGWLGSIAEEEKTGVLVTPDDPVDFADKAIWLRDHPQELKVFSVNARRVAEEQFSRDVLARRLETVLRQAAVKSEKHSSTRIAPAGE
ncbi:glycosyltransferase family 4 protein [Microvirga subterranea]|uniref:Glycosyltransferase involved in cell wall biosynthesis n=1 Tax=Microvirga subterranea TaxID=186651 RepID=A0A370HL48_9HYPH|nr:glycosyltransferase family 4 protein [Microvirga subterranea]RDI59313.1 glycosyltransferase involved in cell wall biosynthesis [Microvirga subterranea]